MSMPVPVPSVDFGPDWANNINACLSIIDGHNHALGTGVQVTPAGLNINVDLPMNDNNLTTTRSVRFTAQGAPLSLPADLDCIYVSGVDLYYNDGAGNEIRLTQGGSIAGSNGSITGLVPPASASYALGTFVFQSAVNTPANIDVGSVIIRNVTAGSNGITVSAPNALASNYTITLPLLPSSTAFMRISPSGTITTVKLYDYIVGVGGDYTTIGAAVAAATTGQSIFIAAGTYVENVTLGKNLSIFGAGYLTVISGSLTFASGSNDSLVQSLKVTGGITINSGVSEIQLVTFWSGTGATVTNNGTGNYIQGMQE